MIVQMATNTPPKDQPAQAPPQLPPPKAGMRFVKKGLGPDVVHPPGPKPSDAL